MITTMTSIELVAFINSERGEGESELRHDHFVSKVPKVLGEAAPKFSGAAFYTNGTGAQVERTIYIFPKREACLMAMSYSYELQAKVFDHMTALESKLAQPVQSLAALPDFTNPAIAARAWAEQFEQTQAANQQLALAAPKVEFVDRYVDATGLKGFREVAKLLGANEARFREFLIEKKIMYRLGQDWHAYQQHADAKRFADKTGTSKVSGHAFNRSMFTPKGVEWIAGLWAVHCLHQEGCNDSHRY